MILFLKITLVVALIIIAIVIYLMALSIYCLIDYDDEYYAEDIAAILDQEGNQS